MSDLFNADTDAAEVAAGAREAEAFLLALRSWPSTGDELHSALSRAVRYGQRDARARGFCRRIQSELQRGQKKRPLEAAEGAKWIVNRKARSS